MLSSLCFCGDDWFNKCYIIFRWGFASFNSPACFVVMFAVAAWKLTCFYLHDILILSIMTVLQLICLAGQWTFPGFTQSVRWCKLSVRFVLTRNSTHAIQVKFSNTWYLTVAWRRVMLGPNSDRYATAFLTLHKRLLEMTTDVTPEGFT